MLENEASFFHNERVSAKQAIANLEDVIEQLINEQNEREQYMENENEKLNIEI